MKLKDFKFRIWDNKKKGYVTDEPIFLGSDGGIYTWKEACVELEPLKNKHFEIEFYTHRIDLNDKKIYDGDIVRAHDGNEELVGLVFFDTYRSMFVLVRRQDLANLKDFIPVVYPFTELFDMVIIGNIHENAELLKERENE